MVKLTQEFIDAALQLADNEQSKISEREVELFGLSSKRLKALLNNLCSKENTNYLEIGVYKGSTLISALFGNNTCKAVGVDNYKYDEREPKRHAPEGGIWPNMKSQLLANLDRYNQFNSKVQVDNIKLIEGNFQDIDWKDQPKFDLCFFDVTPANKEMYDAFFTKTLAVLSSEAVIVFSNYSNEKNAKEIDACITEYSDRFDIQWKKQRVSGGMSDSTQYYSGILILGIKKKIAKINKVT